MEREADTETTVREPVKREPWRNPYRKLIPRARAIAQATYVAFFVLVGWQFYDFYRQVLGDGPVTAHRPPAVESFLPISALLGVRRLLATGQWDAVHPAGLTILIGAIAASLIARKAFCSWICPVGGVSRALEWLGARTLLLRRRKEILVPAWLDKPLMALKYLLLVFFLWAIFWSMPMAAVEAFLETPYNRAADAKMLLFFLEIGPTAALTIAVMIALSLVVKNFWCRYLCPYGALLGLFSWASPVQVVRDPKTCTDCKACTRACPVEIPVHRRLRVLTPECTGCMSCVASCPQKDCLTLTRRGKSTIPAWVVPAAAVGAVLLLWGWARLTGHWETSMSVDELARAYRIASVLGHP